MAPPGTVQQAGRNPPPKRKGKNQNGLGSGAREAFDFPSPPTAHDLRPGGPTGGNALMNSMRAGFGKAPVVSRKVKRVYIKEADWGGDILG